MNKIKKMVCQIFAMGMVGAFAGVSLFMWIIGFYSMANGGRIYFYETNSILAYSELMIAFFALIGLIFIFYDYYKIKILDGGRRA